MLRMRFRLGEADAAKYPDGDKWFDYDMVALADMPASELAALEELMPITIFAMEVGFLRRSQTAMRAAMFVARRLAGVTEQWANFDPRVMKAEYEFPPDQREGDQAEGDAGPPDGATGASPTS